MINVQVNSLATKRTKKIAAKMQKKGYAAETSEDEERRRRKFKKKQPTYYRRACNPGDKRPKGNGGSDNFGGDAQGSNQAAV